MPYVEGIVKVTAIFNCLGEIGNMTQHYMKAVPGVLLDATERAALAGHYDDWWETAHAGGGSSQKGFHPNVVNLTEIAITEYTSAAGNGNPITDRETTGGAGTAGTGVLPAEVAIVLTKRTAGSGARKRGRTYVPFLSSGVLTASQFVVLSTIPPLLAAQYRGLLQEINDDVTLPLTAVVFSFAGGSWEPITHIAVGNQFDTQRRRGNSLLESYTTVAV